MEEAANRNGTGLEKFTGFIFDAALIAAAFLAFRPLVALVEKAPNTVAAVSLIANCLAAGLTLAAVLNGAKLPSLGGFEGLLMVLTPASAFALPIVYGLIAPEGALGGWVWYMPLAALFSTLIVFGAMADKPVATGKTFFSIRAAAAFVWLISAEALIIAFVGFGVEEAALATAVILMTFCWMPARLISAGIDSSRFELLSALVAYGLFVFSIIGGAGPR